MNIPQNFTFAVFVAPNFKYPVCGQ